MKLIGETLTDRQHQLTLRDCCPFKPKFDPNKDADFLTRQLPESGARYCNPPFTLFERFLRRSFWEFCYLGKNLVFLCPTKRFKDSAFATAYIKPIV